MPQRQYVYSRMGGRKVVLVNFLTVCIQIEAMLARQAAAPVHVVDHNFHFVYELAVHAERILGRRQMIRIRAYGGAVVNVHLLHATFRLQTVRPLYAGERRRRCGRDDHVGRIRWHNGCVGNACDRTAQTKPSGEFVRNLSGIVGFLWPIGRLFKCPKKWTGKRVVERTRKQAHLPSVFGSYLMILLAVAVAAAICAIESGCCLRFNSIKFSKSVAVWWCALLNVFGSVFIWVGLCGERLLRRALSMSSGAEAGTNCT